MALMNRMLPDCTDATEADNGIHDLVISDVFSITSLFLKTISKRSAHRAKLCVEGIGGSATNKQKCKCRTFALLATFYFGCFMLSQDAMLTKFSEKLPKPVGFYHS